MYEELIGKPLSYAIKHIDNDIIKICTEYGTNFWYIGSKDAFKAKMPQLTKKLSERFKETYEVEKFIPLSKRVVLEVFDAQPCVDDSTVIYIEGNETGNMWFVGEKPECENGDNLLIPQIQLSDSFLKKRKRGRHGKYM